MCHNGACALSVTSIFGDILKAKYMSWILHESKAQNPCARLLVVLNSIQDLGAIQLRTATETMGMQNHTKGISALHGSKRAVWISRREGFCKIPDQSWIEAIISCSIEILFVRGSFHRRGSRVKVISHFYYQSSTKLQLGALELLKELAMTLLDSSKDTWKKSVWEINMCSAIDENCSLKASRYGLAAIKNTFPDSKWYKAFSKKMAS